MLDSIKAWARKHKKGIIITCSIVTVVGASAILIINGKRVIVPVEELVEDALAETPKTPLLPPIPETAENIVETTFPRTWFIRQLPAGQHASLEKLAQAADMDIGLGPGQTIVNSTTVRIRRAA